MADEFCQKIPDFHVTFTGLLHAVNLRHGTDGFTSPPKEGVLRIFSPWKIQRLRSGLNPRTWVPKASTLHLDHRSRMLLIIPVRFKTVVIVVFLWLNAKECMVNSFFSSMFVWGLSCSSPIMWWRSTTDQIQQSTVNYMNIVTNEKRSTQVFTKM